MNQNNNNRNNQNGDNGNNQNNSNQHNNNIHGHEPLFSSSVNRPRSSPQPPQAQLSPTHDEDVVTALISMENPSMEVIDEAVSLVCLQHLSGGCRRQRCSLCHVATSVTTRERLWDAWKRAKSAKPRADFAHGWSSGSADGVSTDPIGSDHRRRPAVICREPAL
eukprot:PhM_4_TR8169/c0_g1_i1/m.12146